MKLDFNIMKGLFFYCLCEDDDNDEDDDELQNIIEILKL